jgi:hypothetical protein
VSAALLVALATVGIVYARVLLREAARRRDRLSGWGIVLVMAAMFGMFGSMAFTHLGADAGASSMPGVPAELRAFLTSAGIAVVTLVFMAPRSFLFGRGDDRD